MFRVFRIEVVYYEVRAVRSQLSGDESARLRMVEQPDVAGDVHQMHVVFSPNAPTVGVTEKVSLHLLPGQNQLEEGFTVQQRSGFAVSIGIVMRHEQCGSLRPGIKSLRQPFQLRLAQLSVGTLVLRVQ